MHKSVKLHTASPEPATTEPEKRISVPSECTHRLSSRNVTILRPLLLLDAFVHDYPLERVLLLRASYRALLPYSTCLNIAVRAVHCCSAIDSL